MSQRFGFTNGFTRHFVFAFGISALLGTGAWAATYTVSKDGRGAFATIGEAIAKAKNGDEVVILDNAVYAEQVTIDSTKSGLTLRSSTPKALKKPTIKWQDNVNVGPKSCPEALIEKNVTFDQNGALRIMRARNVVIDGIAVDGGGAAPFAWTNVWGQTGVDCNGTLYPLFHGNAGIDLWIAGDAIIRNCDISNSYYGINVKDRNEGGVFANANPADVQKWKVVPLSGFGKTGNHTLENNRIHDNSWAMFFESSWDLGSTIRYNLIYSNYHHGTLAATVKALTSEGANQPGGSILLKDDLLSPLAIYNNTFWDNHLIIAGGWRAGGQHLLFNNLYAKPHKYWSDASDLWPNSFQVLDPAFANRTYNSLFAAQTEAPKLDSQKVEAQEYDQTLMAQVKADSMVKLYRTVRIMNQMGDPEKGDFTVNLTLALSSGPKIVPKLMNGAVLPGALIVGAAGKAFPAAANVRWLETVFKSTDPTSADFLSPDWDDPLAQKFIVNQGWLAAGILDADGSLADIGAISSTGSSTNDFLIKPLSPVIISGTTATLTFNIALLNGTLTNPRIKYLRWMNNVPFGTAEAAAFGGNVAPLPASTDISGSVTGTVTASGSTLTVKVPARAATELYAFAEIVIEGTDATGKTVTTNMGFLPYRTLDYKFEVEVWDAAGTTKLTTVTAGQPVKLRIKALQLNGQPFANVVDPVEIALNSGAELLVPGTQTKITIPGGVDGQKQSVSDVMFTKVPPGGIEIVRVTGLWTLGSQSKAFLGTSDGIKVLPGEPSKVAFQDPPSKIAAPGSFSVVDPGVNYKVKLQVYDAYDNKVSAPSSVTIKSNNTDVGDITGAKTATSDSAGLASFTAAVTGGNPNQTFELEANIVGKPADKADMKVGKPRDKLWILYGDAATGYDEAAEIRGGAGERIAVTLRASQDGKTKIATRVNEFTLEASSGLAIYATPTDATPKTAFTLVAGELVVYITGLREVTNGTLTASPTNDNTFMSDTRAKIFFSVASKNVKSAEYFADNGLGAVDRLELNFNEDLKQAPDSLELAWPISGGNKQIVKAGITLDALDKKHVTVVLATPFPAGITAGGGSLGAAWVSDPAAPEAPAQRLALNIVDKVGPLLDSGRVYEKIVSPAVDTLSLGFSEKVTAGSLVGPSLLLLKKDSGPITLTVISATDLGDGLHFKLVIADLSAQAPVAGDSVKINAAGPATDALGNKAHEKNRPIALLLKTVPRPPILKQNFDSPVTLVASPENLPNFLVLTSAGPNTWAPVSGGKDGIQTKCGSNCGPAITSTDGKITDRPTITVTADRGFKFTLHIYSNTGEFLDFLKGEVTNAELGLDERGISTGAASLYAKVNGNFVIKVGWNAVARNGQKAGTGAYIARYSITVKREDDKGNFVNVEERKDVRFGLRRGI